MKMSVRWYFLVFRLFKFNILWLVSAWTFFSISLWRIITFIFAWAIGLSFFCVEGWIYCSLRKRFCKAFKCLSGWEFKNMMLLERASLFFWLIMANQFLEAWFVLGGLVKTFSSIFVVGFWRKQSVVLFESFFVIKREKPVGFYLLSLIVVSF